MQRGWRRRHGPAAVAPLLPVPPPGRALALAGADGRLGAPPEGKPAPRCSRLPIRYYRRAKAPSARRRQEEVCARGSLALVSLTFGVY